MQRCFDANSSPLCFFDCFGFRNHSEPLVIIIELRRLDYLVTFSLNFFSRLTRFELYLRNFVQNKFAASTLESFRRWVSPTRYLLQGQSKIYDPPADLSPSFASFPLVLPSLVLCNLFLCSAHLPVSPCDSSRAHKCSCWNRKRYDKQLTQSSPSARSFRQIHLVSPKPLQRPFIHWTPTCLGQKLKPIFRLCIRARKLIFYTMTQ